MTLKFYIMVTEDSEPLMGKRISELLKYMTVKAYT